MGLESNQIHCFWKDEPLKLGPKSDSLMLLQNLEFHFSKSGFGGGTNRTAIVL